MSHGHPSIIEYNNKALGFWVVKKIGKNIFHLKIFFRKKVVTTSFP